jgi:hypothetical protein
VKISGFIDSPEMHFLALSADGFFEQHAKEPPGSGSARCFVRVHNGGLLVETQYVETKLPPPDSTAAAPVRRRFPVVIEMKIDLEALKVLSEKARKIRAENPDSPLALAAFLSEYRPVVELLKRIPANAPEDPALPAIRDLLEIVFPY